ncbi:MAG: hypothetical protein U1E31_02120 [Rickettsiales bacterium]
MIQFRNILFITISLFSFNLIIAKQIDDQIQKQCYKIEDNNYLKGCSARECTKSPSPYSCSTNQEE